MQIDQGSVTTLQNTRDQIIYIINNLSVTYTTSSNQQRVLAEQKLKIIQSQDKFINKLCSILSINFNQANFSFNEKQTKLSVCSYISNFVTRTFSHAGILVFERKKQYASVFVETLKNDRVINSHKLLLCQSLGTLVNTQMTHHLGIGGYLLQLVEQSMKESNQNNTQIENFNNYCFFAYSLLCGSKQLKVITTVFQKAFNSMTKQLLVVVTELEIALLNENYNNFVKIKDIVRLGMLVLKKQIFTMQFEKYRATNTEMVNNNNLYLILMKLLNLNLKTSNFLIVRSQIAELTEINEIKLFAAQIFNFIINGIKRIKMKNKENIKIYQYQQILFEKICNSIAREIRLPQQHQLLHVFIHTLIIVSKNSDFFQLVIKWRKYLFLQLIIYLLIPTQERNYLMLEDPFNFIEFLQDLTNKHINKNRQTIAATLLEALCDNIDGSLSFISDICLTTLQFSITNNIQILNLTDSDYLKSQFFNKSDFTTKIQISLLILSILSYIIPRRKDILLKLERIIELRLQYFVSNNTVRETLIFALFYCYYADELFQRQQNIKYHFTIVQYFIKLLGNANKQFQVVRLQIYEVLHNTIGQLNFFSLFAPHIIKIINYIIGYMNMPQNFKLLELLTKIFEIYHKQILTNGNTQFLQWLHNINLHILNNLNRSQQNQIAPVVFSLVQQLMSMQQYFIYINEIFELSIPFFIYLNMKCNYHENILALFNQYIKFTNNVPPIISKVLAAIKPIIQKENNGHIRQFFRTFNYICIYINHSSQNNEIIEEIINLVLSATFTVQSDTTSNDLLQGVLLLHLLIYYHVKLFNHTIKQHIIRQSLRCIKDQSIKSQQSLYGKYCLNLIMLLNDSLEFTHSILGEKISEVYEILYENPGQYKQSYDKKGFIINQIHILQRYQKEKYQNTFSGSSFRIIVELIRDLYDSQRNIIRDDYQDKNDSIDISDQELEQQIFQHKNKIQRNLISPFKLIDQFSLFKKFIIKIRFNQETQQFYRQIVSTLPYDLQEFLKEMALSIQKVVSEGNKMKPRQIMKVKKMF